MFGIFRSHGQQHNWYYCHVAWKAPSLSTLLYVWAPKKSRCAWIILAEHRPRRIASKYDSAPAKPGTATPAHVHPAHRVSMCHTKQTYKGHLHDIRKFEPAYLAITSRRDLGGTPPPALGTTFAS